MLPRVIGKPAPFLISGEVGVGFSDIAPSSRKGVGALQQQYRLRRNGQFSYVYRRGRRASSKNLSLLYVKSQQKRVGFSVNKKVGCAVVRNRTKRRLREAVRPLMPCLKNGLYVLVARPSAAEQPFARLDAEVRALLARLDALRGGEAQPSCGR